MRKIFWTISLSLIIPATMFFTFLARAQGQGGSISGTVYRDINANGVCVNEAEPRVAANIPMELVADDVGELVRISTTVDGTYSYSTEVQGLWRVTVVPGQGWRVTSQQTLEVVLTEDGPDAINVDFCIIELEQPPEEAPTLPESGIAIAPLMLLAATIGFVFIGAGAILLLLGRSHKA
jgi:hypothetical protein